MTGTEITFPRTGRSYTKFLDERAISTIVCLGYLRYNSVRDSNSLVLNSGYRFYSECRNVNSLSCEAHEWDTHASTQLHERYIGGAREMVYR